MALVTAMDYSDMTTPAVACYRPERDERAEATASRRRPRLRRCRLVRPELSVVRDPDLGRRRLVVEPVDRPGRLQAGRRHSRCRARHLPGLPEIRSVTCRAGRPAEAA